MFLGKLKFNKGWASYKFGFQSQIQEINGMCAIPEYWIGLDNIFQISSHFSETRLMIELQRYNGQSGRISFDNFQIGNESESYQLKSVGKFTNDPILDIGNSFEGAGFGKQGYSPVKYIKNVSKFRLRRKFIF